MPNYQEQLESPEWRKRRDVIINRDNNRCSFCEKGPSLNVRFGETTIFIGIDYSKKEVDCSKAILSTAIKWVDYIKTHNITNLKRGTLPNSNTIGFISPEGYYLHSVWNKDNYIDIDLKQCHIVKVPCDDGVSVDVIFLDEKDLQNLKLPRAFVQRKPSILQVHHKRYIYDKNAWEYDDEDLVTLCQDCHSKVHKYLPVQTYANVNGQMKVMNYTPCQRCNGAGYLPEYDYIENGICFRCRGARFEELIENNYEDVNLF